MTLHLPPGLAVTMVDHVGIAVPNLDAAIDFHVGTLGGVLVHREINEEQGVEEAMISFGASGGTQIQLLAALTPESAIAKFISRSGPGLQQLALRVPNIDDAMATIRASGLRLLYEQARRGTANSRINFVHPKDTGGVLLELVEPASTL
ncbi:methylmalonyl-CoA epimerase [Nakamurella antarctica]|uniref:Methylmalonyl-CoA epimerase n=1 Tax=Nakamurella antarctica TaxID=1902245 RepID=A0A3G8ZKS2_9ACTN|nr:methylmalonyl-CoA epimerase [Nakamurella antarctica]AZI57843.1 methylmalonyl-CoA epimerase [Nakamurella antarctica]